MRSTCVVECWRPAAPFRRGSPRSREVRKEMAFPALKADSLLDSIWQIYGDDADYPELVKKSAKHGEPLPAAQSRESCQSLAVPQDGARAGSRCRLCGAVDGIDARIGAPPERAALLEQLTCHALHGGVYCKEPEIAAGHGCHAFGFRRVISSVFKEIWRAICTWGTAWRRRVNDAVSLEL